MADKKYNILHMADLHFCEKHWKHVENCFMHALYSPAADDLDALVIAGDTFHHAVNAHDDSFIAALRCLNDAANIKGVPVYVLQGTYSHDRPGTIRAFSVIPGVEVIERPTMIEQENGLRLSFLPSLNRADPAARENYREWVATQTSRFADQRPHAFVSHGTVVGSVTESGYAMIAPDHEFTEEDLYASGARAIMLGHIHKHQGWTNGEQDIAYTGSLSRLVYGHHDQTGALLWRVDDESAEYEMIETPSPDLIEVSFDGPPNIEQLQELAADIGETDHVRIRWDVDEDQAHTVDKAAIRELFSSAGALKLEGTVNPIQSVRAPGIGRAQSVHEKLEAWMQTTGDADKYPVVGELLTDLMEGRA